MIPQRWQRIGEIYHSALPLTPAERAAFVTNACAGDPKHSCIGPDCCYADYLAGKCAPAQSCGAWTYK